MKSHWCTHKTIASDMKCGSMLTRVSRMFRLGTKKRQRWELARTNKRYSLIAYRHIKKVNWRRANIVELMYKWSRRLKQAQSSTKSDFTHSLRFSIISGPRFPGFIGTYFLKEQVPHIFWIATVSFKPKAKGAVFSFLILRPLHFEPQKTHFFANGRDVFSCATE